MTKIISLLEIVRLQAKRIEFHGNPAVKRAQMILHSDDYNQMRHSGSAPTLPCANWNEILKSYHSSSTFAQDICVENGLKWHHLLEYCKTTSGENVLFHLKLKVMIS